MINGALMTMDNCNCMSSEKLIRCGQEACCQANNIIYQTAVARKNSK